MGATTGLNAIGFYIAGTMAARLDALLALIPDPDAALANNGAVGGGGGATNTYLDEMSPAAAAQLRVELASVIAGNPVAFSQYTVVANDATAHLVNIVTGLADLTLANTAVVVRRGGTVVTGDAVITEPSAGTIRVADGASTYTVTAGDIITWAVVA